MIFNIRKPKLGDLKTVTRFALFPVRIDHGTVVWLEKYSAEYLLCREMGAKFKHWKIMRRWIDKGGVEE